MTKFRFHVIALPHLAVTKENSCCAYTQKIFQFCKMMSEIGHEVFLYAPEGSDAPCSRFFQTISTKELEVFYGVHPKEKMFPLNWDANEPLWQLTNSKALFYICQNRQPKDFVCLATGSQALIASKLPDLLCVEPWIGYYGTCCTFRCFESYAHMHTVNAMRENGQNSPRNYDWVIPNYYDIEDFPLIMTKADYLLYIGRMIPLKGISIAVETAKATGLPLFLAGQGITGKSGGRLQYDGGEIDYNKATYLGVLGPKERAKVMGNARAVLVPSQYVEPFGGVNVEAQLCGTPVITSDWGAFPETVEHGKSGFRCRTMRHYIDAVAQVKNLDPVYIRERAICNWSTTRVCWMFQEFFERLYDLHDPLGWSRIHGQPSDPLWLSPFNNVSGMPTLQETGAGRSCNVRNRKNLLPRPKTPEALIPLIGKLSSESLEG